MQMEITGKFLGATTIEEVGSKNYKVRKFYIDITDNPQYPNTPEFTLGGDKNVGKIDGFAAGTDIKVKFEIQGKKYVSKKDGSEGVFTTLNAWSVEAVSSATAMTPAPAAKPAVTKPLF